MSILLMLGFLLQEENLERLIEQLGAGTAEVREKAEKALLSAGAKALPGLDKAVDNPDPEVRQRVKAITKILRPKDSREALENIEESLQKASSVSVVFKGETLVRSKEEDEGFRTVFEGEVLIKPGGKARYSFTQRRDASDKKTEYLLISDGVGMCSAVPGKPPMNVPVELKQTLSAALVRLGGCAMLRVAYSLSGSPPALPSLETFIQAVKLSDFEDVAKDGDLNVIGYSLRAPEYGLLGRIRLWYDPKTYLPVRRSLVVPVRNTTISESYQTFVLQAEIPDERFSLPQTGK